jgi:serine/threonine protein kinase/Flp pilus assembly protein TadD
MNERSVFLEALEIDDAMERAAFLERACAGDPDLRVEVERLLSVHLRDGSFLERPAADLDETVDRPAIAERPGTFIGPYRLMEQIGEGGFGLVFVAEQTKPVRRKVALKLIKPGMDTREVIARFEAERQALALMDHPNIARVLDAGATDNGRPYFVMELVKGIPITDYCDQAQLTPRERLELFVPVCQAVQHAHQKGVIHRDLKPSNVLVTLHDGTPVVKVIDFGVAKAIGQHLTERTIYTRFAQMIGTPLYMSPEQAEMSGLDIDTRSDVYSLGVLLYELLTGSTPFDRHRFGTAAFDEIRRIIREEEPPKPSTRLTSLGQSLTAVSARRKTEPKKLSAMVKGDLDWIVMKALEKDRARRYETAGAFAADVRRFLAEEPVEARPPSAWYRFGKLARRNRVALATAGAVAGALVLGIAVATWQAVRATRAATRAVHAEGRALAERDAAERARAEAVVAQKKAEDFAERLSEASALVGQASAHAGAGHWATARALFAQAEELQPGLVSIYTSRAAMYQTLGLWDLAAADLQQALTRARGMPGWTSAEWYQHALLRLYVGDQEAYRDACREMLDRFGGSERNMTTIETVRACALAPRAPGEAAQLVRWARQVTDIDKAAWLIYVEGLALYRAGEYRQAAERLETALKIDPFWKANFIVQPGLALAYHRLGEPGRAKDALARAEKLLNDGIDALRDMPLGMLPAPWFDLVEFMQFYGEAWQLLRGSPPPEYPQLRAHRERALAALVEVSPEPWIASARAHERRGDWVAAATDYGRLLDLMPRKLGPYSDLARVIDVAAARPEIFDVLAAHRPDDAQLWVARGRALARQKQWSTALAAYDRVMASRPPDRAAMLEYASLYLLAGDTPGYRRLCARLVEKYGKDSDVDIAQNLSRVCTLAEGAVAESELPLAWAELWTTRRPPLPWTVHAVGAAYYRAGKFDEAVRHFRESQAGAPTWPGQCMNDAFLALAHARLGQADEARRSLAKTDRWLADADRDLAAENVGFPPKIFPADWLIVQVLRREAARVLAEQPANSETPQDPCAPQ